MRFDLCSHPIEPFLVIGGDIMDWGYGNALVVNIGYTLCCFGGTTVILVSNIWAFLFFYIPGFNSFRTQNEEYLLFC